MPLYEYRCADCGSLLEVLQRVGDGPGGLECPGCGGARLEKEFSTFASAAPGGCAPGARFT